MDPSLFLRKIIHVDIDAFFASVERIKNPELLGKPMAVGGSPKGRGVITSPSYEARAFGVRSGMAVKSALRLCPRLILVRSSFSEYLEYSSKIKEILGTFTDKFQMVSIDEGYLDVSDQKVTPYARDLAKLIKKTILEKTGLTASAGVAPNKLLAKIGSDFHKPDGLTVISPELVASFMKNLRVSKIPGIGPKTDTKLSSIGIVTCEDVLDKGARYWKEKGRFGNWLYQKAQGLDERDVVERSSSKSIGCQSTLPVDTNNIEDLLKKMEELSSKVSDRMEKKQYRGNTLTVIIRYFDFSDSSKSHTFSFNFSAIDEINSLSVELFKCLWKNPKKIRKIGISVSGLQKISENSLSFYQPSLF